MGIIHFETFLLTGILLNLTPGNDTIFILSKSVFLAQTKRADPFAMEDLYDILKKNIYYI